MDTLAILALLEAKPGKEEELEAFLKSALPMAEAEPGTTTWFALKIGGGRYGIFDTFPGRSERDAHIGGPIAKALFSRAEELLAKPPQIEQPEVLAAKSPKG